jgi:hypothetical protein
MEQPRLNWMMRSDLSQPDQGISMHIISVSKLSLTKHQRQGLTTDNVRDDAFMALLIWALLEAFLAHATPTVCAHVSEVRFMST